MADTQLFNYKIQTVCNMFIDIVLSSCLRNTHQSVNTSSMYIYSHKLWDSLGLLTLSLLVRIGNDDTTFLTTVREVVIAGAHVVEGSRTGHLHGAHIEESGGFIQQWIQRVIMEVVTEVH